MKVNISFNNMVANKAYERFPIDIVVNSVLIPNKEYDISVSIMGSTNYEKQKFLLKVCNNSEEVCDMYYKLLTYLVLIEICHIDEIVDNLYNTDTSLENINELIESQCVKKISSCSYRLHKKLEAIYFDIGMREHENFANSNFKFLMRDNNEWNNESVAVTPYGVSFAFKHFV